MVFQENRDPGLQPVKTAVYLLLPLVFLLLVLPVNPFFSGQVFVSEYHDAMALMLPDLHLAQNPLALWNDQWLTGFSESASLNTDRFYPFSFPFTLLSNDIFIINLILLVNLYIAFLAFYTLGSYLVKNQELLFLFATAYMLSGVLVSRVFIGHISFVYAMAWIPLVYYFFLRIVHRRDVTALTIAGLAVSETLLLFTGGMYYLFFCNAILAIFFLYAVIAGRATKATWAAILASAALVALLGAVKLIPNFLGMPYIQRIDPINPLGDGGLLENNLASFIFGMPIDTVFGPYETMALIGAVPVLFAIIALVWGDREITIPSFWAIVFSFVWADGGRILISFIHLLPLVSSFRNAGRIFGAVMPLVLLLSLYGVYIVCDRLKKGEAFSVTADQKRLILTGVGVLVLLKVLELPWLAVPSPEAALAVLLVFGFIALIWLDRLTAAILQGYLAVALLITAAILAKNFTILTGDIILKGAIFALLLIGALLIFTWNSLERKVTPVNVIAGILVAAIIVSVVANVSVLKVSDPKLGESPALKVIEKIRESPAANPKIWIYENGWPIQHMDFTYWFIKNGMHPMRGFYSYVPLNTPPLALKFNGTDYFTADYLVDTAYLENGNENLPAVSYKVENISVYKPDHVLPNAFVVRGEGTLVPSTIEKYSPDEIVISGAFKRGDVALIKTAYYPGWKINGADTANVVNMPAAELPSDAATVTFRYDPIDVKAGLVLSLLGIIGLLALLFGRKQAEQYLSGLGREAPEEKTAKKRRKEH